MYYNIIYHLYHTITSTKCAQMRHSLIWLWLSSVVVYGPQMTLPRFELIYCPNRYIEEICRLQFASTRINCTIQTLNASKIGYWIWPKWSNIVIVQSLLGIFLAVVDILSTWMYRRGLVTSTPYNTHILYKTPAQLHPDDSGLICEEWAVSFIVTSAAIRLESTSIQPPPIRAYIECRWAVAWCE